MAVESWSTTPANNSQTPPNGAPEGMLPAQVNDTLRQQMADHATLVRQYPWLKLSTGQTVVRNSDTQFQLSSVNLTTIYTVGRRIKSIGATTVYGVIAASSFSGGHTVVDVTNDSAANLPASLTAVDVSVIENVNALNQSAFSITQSQVSDHDKGRFLIPTSNPSGVSTFFYSDLTNSGIAFYEFEIENLTFSTDGNGFLVRSNTTNSTSTFDTGASDYQYSTVAVANATTTPGTDDANDSIFLFGSGVTIGNAAGEYYSALFRFWVGSASTPSHWEGGGFYRDTSGRAVWFSAAGARLANGMVRCVQFASSAGTFTGTIRLWGNRK